MNTAGREWPSIPCDTRGLVLCFPEVVFSEGGPGLLFRTSLWDWDCCPELRLPALHSLILTGSSFSYLWTLASWGRGTAKR